MARNSTEQLVTSSVGSREDPLFPAHRINTTLPSICECGIKLVSGVFA